MRYILPLIGVVIIMGALAFLLRTQGLDSNTEEPTISPVSTTVSPNETPAPTNVQTPTPTPESLYALPIAEVKTRISKKGFGDYFTPANSPVENDRFTGYHTGIDVEYEDIAGDVPVYAIADCAVEQARTASGYGGLLILKCQIEGQARYAVYGHVRLSSIPKVGQIVTKGQQIGVLGTGKSSETDGERKHLHFAIVKTVDVRGYVQKESELSNWIDPLSLYK